MILLVYCNQVLMVTWSAYLMGNSSRKTQFWWTSTSAYIRSGHTMDSALHTLGGLNLHILMRKCLIKLQLFSILITCNFRNLCHRRMYAEKVSVQFCVRPCKSTDVLCRSTLTYALVVLLICAVKCTYFKRWILFWLSAACDTNIW